MRSSPVYRFLPSVRAAGRLVGRGSFWKVLCAFAVFGALYQVTSLTTGGTQAYPPAHPYGWVAGVVAVLAALGACGSLAFGFATLDNPERRLQVHKAWILAVWILAPPLWFSFEYNALWTDEWPSEVKGDRAASVRLQRDVDRLRDDLSRQTDPGKASVLGLQLGVARERASADAEVRKTRLERLKQSQDVASKFWLAISSLLTGLFFGKDFIRPGPTS
jgi:hypothetical protein